MVKPSDMQVFPPTDWQKFERMMRDLFEAKWGSTAHMHGRTGQPQHGVDIFGQPEGKADYHGRQCKRRDAQADEAITTKELAEEVEKARKFQPPIRRFSVLVTGKRDTKIRHAARDLDAASRAKGGFAIEVLFWDDIKAIYDRHPKVYELHYGFGGPMRPIHQLPPPPGDFTGRKEELEEMLGSVATSGLAISGLRGQGGIGKTALGLVAADKLAECYPDAQCFLDLKGVSKAPLTPAEAMAHVIRGFEPEAQLPDDPARLAGMYLSALHGRRAIIFLDNAADAAQVQPLIPPTTCLLIVTSRKKFHLPGLRPWDLDSLPEEDAKSLLLRTCPRIGGSAGRR